MLRQPLETIGRRLRSAGFVGFALGSNAAVAGAHNDFRASQVAEFPFDITA